MQSVSCGVGGREKKDQEVEIIWVPTHLIL